MRIERHFDETQRFTQPWIWVLLVGSLALTLGVGAWATYQQIWRGIPWGDNPMSDTGLLIYDAASLLFSGGIVALMRSLRLETFVDASGIYVQMRPLHRRPIHYDFDELASVKARTYAPILEYGGWGIRGSSEKNKAYNVRGERGVQLAFKDGRRVLIGSQRADELAEIIQEQAAAR